MGTIITTDRAPAASACSRLAPVTSFALAGFLFGPAVQAAEWRVAPTLGTQLVYTDNVRLAPEGAERSDYIFDLSPGIAVTADGPRLKLRARYAFQYLTYANDNKGNSSFHQLNGAANVQLVDDLFWIDGDASVGQRTISLDGPRPTSNFAITDNRTTVKTASISPYLRHDYGGIATSELRYTRSFVDSGVQGLSANNIDRLNLSVASGQAFRTLGWGLNASSQRTELSDDGSLESANLVANLRYMLTPQLYLTATGGYDKYDYPEAGNRSAPEGALYTAGFAWRPTERTSLDASAGKRFYGNTYQLASSVRSRHSVWRLSYDESVTTTQSEFADGRTLSTSDFLNELFRSSIPDASLRQQAVDRFIQESGLPPVLTQSINYFTNRIFLQKALRGSVALTGARNTVLFSVYNVDRRPQTAGTDPASELSQFGFIDPGDTRQTGASALWTWKLGPRVSATFGADTVRTSTDLGSQDGRLTTYRTAFTRRLQPKVTGGIELRHAQQSSDTGRSYRENAVTAFLAMAF